MMPVKKDGAAVTAPDMDSTTRGRTFGSDPKEQNENESTDISSIDQQEGNMENGALGGNFEEEINNNNSEDKK